MDNLSIDIDKYTFICPITHQYFNEPAFFERFYFEKDALKKWLKDNNTHPLTNVNTSNKTYFKCSLFDNLLNEFYKNIL